MADAKKEVAILSFEKVEAPITKSAEHRTLYINSTRVSLSPWDIRMMLGQVVETDGGQQINEDLVTIIMSPQHIKAFVAGILRTIAAYEKTFGEIPDNLKLVREKVEAKAKKT